MTSPVDGLRAVCAIEGCEKPSRRCSQGWCEMHYIRWWRHGDPNILRPNTRPFTIHSEGYRLVRGQYEHRAVLMAKVGPDPQPCHWCGVTVFWGQNTKEHPDTALTADVDGDKQNNDSDNLVPSCFRCNLFRGGRDDQGRTLPSHHAGAQP